MIDLVPLGDRAWLARFPDEAAASVWADSARLALGQHPGVLDIVLAFKSVAVHADPDRADLDGLEHQLRGLVVSNQLKDSASEHATFEIPVLYDGPDLLEVARLSGLSAEGVSSLHAAPVYTIWAIGFLPGFPYAGPLPDPLASLPRRDTPRAAVPAGSVAIAAGQTAIYPRSSPGGWHLLGRTPLVIADPDSAFFPLRAGDRLRFVPIDGPAFLRLEGERLQRSES